MFKSKKSWIIGAAITFVVIVAVVLLFIPKQTAQADDPWAHVPKHSVHTDHTVTALQGPFETGEQVTQACLECHPEAGEQMLHSSHFTWEHGPYEVEGHEDPVYGGKKNLMNNFCLSNTPNWPPCTTCHAGYG